MAVTLDLTQSGSASTEIHAASGDTVTLLLGTTHGEANSVLSYVVGCLGGLSNVTGVAFAVNTAGNGSYALTLTQSGSGTTAIDAASGDTITLVLAATVENDILAWANTCLQALLPFTGVAFAFSTAGNAS